MSLVHLQGGCDVGVAQPVVESDGTVHAVPRVTAHDAERERRLRKSIARRRKGSNRRERAKRQLGAVLAARARRRQDVAHRISARLAAKYTHLACEDLELRNMTRSASGTVEQPGRNVAQKRGLNRDLLDMAPGQIRRMTAYKMERTGGTFVAVSPHRTSQDCSECGRHPADAPETAHLPHGRVGRSFHCPLCGYAADADHNAARNVRARGRQQWADNQTTAAGPAVSGRGALCGTGRESAPVRGMAVKRQQRSGQAALSRAG